MSSAQPIFSPPSSHQLRTWDTLIPLIRSRLAHKSRANILYGDLSEVIFGKRNIGGQAFSGSLHEIHIRTDAYNRRFQTRHPRLNSLVFNIQGKQPGIPAHQDPQKVWQILEAYGPSYLDRLGVLLGYHDFVPSKKTTRRAGGRKPKDGAGPSGGGVRSEATWKAHHSPIVHEITKILDHLQWSRLASDHWSPDVLFKSPSSDRKILIEVKPSNSTHDIITAIGQTVCYRSSFKNIKAAIAAPGMKLISQQLKRVIIDQKIRIIDLDGDVGEQLRELCG